jgi:hypothetical protein
MPEPYLYPRPPRLRPREHTSLDLLCAAGLLKRHPPRRQPRAQIRRSRHGAEIRLGHAHRHRRVPTFDICGTSTSRYLGGIASGSVGEFTTAIHQATHR